MSQGYFTRSDAGAAGAALAAAREELELSVDDVARHLKLTPAQVEALEEGAYERLPGRVFVRGFLRNYAKLLGLDPQPLLRRMEHEMPQPKQVDEPPPAPEAIMPTGEPSRMPVYGGVAVVVIAALAVYEFGFNSPPADPAAAEGQPANATTAAAAGAGSASVGTPRATSAAGAASLAPAIPPGAAAPGTGAAHTLTSAPAGLARTDGLAANAALDRSLPALGEDAPPTVSTPGERALQFQFEQESWVEIRDKEDKIIFSKLNQAGTQERVTGTPPFKLVVGNARGVRLTYDGKPVDLTPHIGVTVARLTVK